MLAYEMVVAFIAKAHEMGRPSLALATALQFELTMRQGDVIGRWEDVDDDASGIVAYGKRWTGGLTWGPDRGAVLTSKRRRPVEYDLTAYPLVVQEVERIPVSARVGPMVVNEATGLPYKPRRFQLRWREIARASGIPDEVYNMDARAGGITEGSDAEADIEHLRHHAAHKNAQTTGRYNRATMTKTRKVAEKRVAFRNRGKT